MEALFGHLEPIFRQLRATRKATTMDMRTAMGRRFAIQAPTTALLQKTHMDTQLAALVAADLASNLELGLNLHVG